MKNKIHKRKIKWGRWAFTRLKGLETYCTFPDTGVKGSFRIFQIYWSLTVLWFPHQTICNLLPCIGAVFLSYCIFSSQKSNYHISSWKKKNWKTPTLWGLESGLYAFTDPEKPTLIYFLGNRGNTQFLGVLWLIHRVGSCCLSSCARCKDPALQRDLCERALRCSSWGLREDENKILKFYEAVKHGALDGIKKKKGKEGWMTEDKIYLVCKSMCRGLNSYVWSWLDQAIYPIFVCRFNGLFLGGLAAGRGHSGGHPEVNLERGQKATTWLNQM